MSSPRGRATGPNFNPFTMPLVDFSEARLTTLAVHKVGNKVKNQGVQASKQLFPLGDEITAETLQDFFLKPFKDEVFFRFDVLDLPFFNPVKSLCDRFFKSSFDRFLPTSVEVLEFLYDQGDMPHIKAGELFVAHFREVMLQGVVVEAIGIFKTEDKDVFLRIDQSPGTVQPIPEQGVSVRKLDKGCLVFNTYEDDGYSVMIVDKGKDGAYWRDDFLKVVPIHDDAFQTMGFLSLVKAWVDDTLSRDVNAKDRVAFLSEVISYFKNHEAFDLEEFKNEVLKDEIQRGQFTDYLDLMKEDFQITPEYGFTISKYGVRKMRPKFKTVITLDTDIEIRYKGKQNDADDFRANVEYGHDALRGMDFYKVYFRNED